MKPEQLEAIRKRSDKASGNWIADYLKMKNAQEVLGDDVPALIAEVERLNGVVGALISQLELIEEMNEYANVDAIVKGAIKYASEEIR